MALKYQQRKVREICHAVKERDTIAVKEMADYFLSLEVIKSGSILIPAPQHEGIAIYTKSICEIIAEKTGCRIADVLKSEPREMLYEQKKKGKKEVWFSMKKEVAGTDLFFVDNVMDTGTTFREANRLLKGRLKPLVYAVVNS